MGIVGTPLHPESEEERRCKSYWEAMKVKHRIDELYAEEHNLTTEDVKRYHNQIIVEELRKTIGKC